MKTKLLTGFIASLFITSNSLSEDDHHREHGAHSHGLAQVNMAIDGNTLAIELESPAANIVGFEHKPKSSQEHETLESAMAILRKPTSLFVTDAAANCKVVHVEIHSSLAGDDDQKQHEDHHDKEHHARQDKHHEHEEHGEDETHSDIEAHYELSCVNTDKLKTVDIKLFERFPAMHNITLQFIGERGQTSAKLNHDAPIFKLPL